MDHKAARASVELEPPSKEQDPTVLPRLICTAGVAGLIGANLGLHPALYWLAAVLPVELLVGLISGNFRRREVRPPRWQELCLDGLVFTNTSLWSAPAALFWISGQPTLQCVAFGLLSVQLFFASTFAYRHVISLITCGIPPVVAMIVLPVAFGGREGLTQHLTLIGGAALCVFFAAWVAFANYSMLATLKQTQDRLQEQTEAALAANAAKSDFLALMSHELRTPMNGVLGMAQILRDTALDESQARQVDMLIRSGDSLLGILNDILDLSKIEAGRLELSLEPFDLHDSARQVFEIWTQIARARGLDLRLDISPAVPVWVLGDGLRVRQIMINLVSNAVKFTTEGQVRLALDATAEGDLHLRVEDTGPGIDLDTQARLFTAFTQASSATARRHGGTGLGLSICRNLAGLMGGRIELTSQVGVGSCFTVTLPLPGTEAPPAADPAAAHDDMDLGSLRVLVVEDNQINQVVAETMLRAVGLDVTLAGDGAEALEKLRTQAFDLVLMDIHMPHMDGIEATARIRRGEAGHAGIPIIALTADVMSGERERLIDLGFDDLKSKPVRPAELLSAVGAVIERRGAAAGSEPVAQRQG